MSSYTRELKNPKTGKMQKAYCIDDHFGLHEYGYGFRKDGKDADWINLACLDELDIYKFEELK